MDTTFPRLGRIVRTALLAPALLLAACDDDSSGPEGLAALRFVHASPASGTVNVRWGGEQVFVNVPYGGSAGHELVAAGERSLAARAIGATADLAASNLELEDDRTYTALVIKAGAAPAISLLVDDAAAPAAGKAKLRVVHAAAAITGNTDIYVTAPDDDLVGATPAAAAVQPGKASAYLVLDPGTYRIRYTTPGTKTVAFDAGNITLGAGQVRTVLAIDAVAGGGAMQAITLQDRNP